MTKYRANCDLESRDHSTALFLELASGLRFTPSTLRWDEWVSVLKPLRPVVARVVVLKFLHGLSVRNIAERLNRSDVIVDRLWTTARKALNHERIAEMLEVK
jgi:DNA-directed RNA polymerase specialized sigma24 family protein